MTSLLTELQKMYVKLGGRKEDILPDKLDDAQWILRKIYVKMGGSESDIPKTKVNDVEYLIDKIEDKVGDGGGGISLRKLHVIIYNKTSDDAYLSDVIYHALNFVTTSSGCIRYVESDDGPCADTDAMYIPGKATFETDFYYLINDDIENKSPMIQIAISVLLESFDNLHYSFEEDAYVVEDINSDSEMRLTISDVK